MNSYSVTWSPTARLTYYRILEYLAENWTIKEIESFIDRTEEVINHICNNHLLYPYSIESDTYKMCSCETSKSILQSKNRFY